MIFDELQHRQPDRELWDVFEFAGLCASNRCAFRSRPRGRKIKTGVWHEQREYSEQVEAAVIPDTEHLGLVFRALETDDIDSEETWKKANPSLGHTITFEDFAKDLAEAKAVPGNWPTSSGSD